MTIEELDKKRLSSFTLKEVRCLLTNTLYPVTIRPEVQPSGKMAMNQWNYPYITIVGASSRRGLMVGDGIQAILDEPEQNHGIFLCQNGNEAKEVFKCWKSLPETTDALLVALHKRRQKLLEEAMKVRNRIMELQKRK